MPSVPLLSLALKLDLNFALRFPLVLRKPQARTNRSDRPAEYSHLSWRFMHTSDAKYVEPAIVFTIRNL
ncbi:MAG: hypothetical protein AAFX40_09270, partial [Cyanobacteria bacterium J06639_1]